MLMDRFIPKLEEKRKPVLCTCYGNFHGQTETRKVYVNAHLSNWMTSSNFGQTSPQWLSNSGFSKNEKSYIYGVLTFDLLA